MIEDFEKRANIQGQENITEHYASALNFSKLISPNRLI